jgi:phospholipase C
MSNLSNIKYIVFLMLENRSFDNLLGWCYDGGTPKLNYIPPLLGAPTYHGLTSPLLRVFEQPVQWTSGGGDSYPIVRGVQGNYFPHETPIVDPEESFLPVTQQLFGPNAKHPSGTPQMLGFLQSMYDAWWKWDEVYFQILDTYDPFASPAQAPIINFLARNFGVSDMWFSSIPSQTSINRAFSLTGNSVGWKTTHDLHANVRTAMVDNNYYGVGYTPAQFVGPTIFDVLYNNNYKTEKDWRIYYSNVWPPVEFASSTSYTYQMFPSLQKTLGAYGDQRKRMNKPIQAFFDDLEKGDLPAFSYLEPDYTMTGLGKFGYQGNDYHPPGDITDGEQFLANLYTKITESSLWDDMLFIISFDEHGGTFDHVAPPWDAVDPSPQYNAARYEHDFQFNRFGVRVPTIFVSPWVAQNTVIRSSTNVPFDHTSLLSTLLDWFDLSSLNSGPAPVLGRRTATAPSFAPVIASTKRTDIPKVPPITEADLSHVGARSNGTFDGAIALLAARRLAAQRGLDDEREILRDILATCKTARDLAEFVRANRIPHNQRT